MNAEHSTTARVTLTVDLDQLMGSVYDEDGDEVGARRLRDEVADALARRLAKDVSKDVRAAVLPAVEAQVGTIVTEALSEPFQPMTTYGSPDGSPTTLRELIGKQARDFLTVPRDQFASGRSPLAKFIQEQVDRAFNAELKKEVDKARDQVLARVKENAAAVIAETIQRMATGR